VRGAHCKAHGTPRVDSISESGTWLPRKDAAARRRGAAPRERGAAPAPSHAVPQQSAHSAEPKWLAVA